MALQRSTPTPGATDRLLGLLCLVVASTAACLLLWSGAKGGTFWGVALLSLAALLSGVQGIRTD